jgi:hypothetical protein
MTNYELAFDEDGEPFGVPPEVAGWRVRRSADGRGRPALIHDKGKPLIVRANASHAELLAAAGPGRYRLEAVNEHRQKVEGVPTACTGLLSADEDDAYDDDVSTDIDGSSTVRQPARSYEDVLCTVVTANTRMVEKALGQMSSVMAGVADLLKAAHHAGITNRLLPAPPPPPPPPPPLTEIEDDEDDEEPEDEDSDEAVGSMLPDVVQLILKEAVAKAVPLIIERLTSGAGFAGLPLEAILDWRKAVPTPAAAPSAPVAPAAPAAPAVPSAPSSPAASSVPAAHVAQAQAAAVSTGPAPSHDSRLGAVPAEGQATPVTSSRRTQDDAAAMLNAHVLQIWQGLSPPERARASQLIARLTAEERAAWLAVLAGLTVPDAIAHARAALRGQSGPPTPPLPTTTPQGDPP